MTTRTMGTEPLVDVAKPVMTSPVGGRIYSAPVLVSGIASIGSVIGTADYEASFFEPSQQVKGNIPPDKSIHFNYDLTPGPKRLDIRTGYRVGDEQSWSPWLAIDWFYVLTPPID